MIPSTVPAIIRIECPLSLFRRPYDLGVLGSSPCTPQAHIAFVAGKARCLTESHRLGLSRFNSGARNMTTTKHEDDTSVGRQLRHISKPDAADTPKAYRSGRRCKSAACITALSVYNKGPYCWIHGRWINGNTENSAIETVEELAELMAA